MFESVFARLTDYLTVSFVFRVMMGAFPMYIPDNPVPKKQAKKPEDEI